MSIPAVVRAWNPEEGWGIVDSDETPGGCWAHFSHVQMDGYKELSAGQAVRLVWEAAAQDGFSYRAVSVTPLQEPRPGR